MHNHQSMPNNQLISSNRSMHNHQFMLNHQLEATQPNRTDQQQIHPLHKSQLLNLNQKADLE
jgi:hypothetical protein